MLLLDEKQDESSAFIGGRKTRMASGEKSPVRGKEPKETFQERARAAKADGRGGPNQGQYATGMEANRRQGAIPPTGKAVALKDDLCNVGGGIRQALFRSRRSVCNL